MNKFCLGFLCMLLVCDTGKAYAAERIVTSHLISNVWYENIFLMADKVRYGY